MTPVHTCTQFRWKITKRWSITRKTWYIARHGQRIGKIYGDHHFAKQIMDALNRDWSRKKKQ